jgi:hypothetical protein
MAAAAAAAEKVRLGRFASTHDFLLSFSPSLRHIPCMANALARIDSLLDFSFRSDPAL